LFVFVSLAGGGGGGGGWAGVGVIPLNPLSAAPKGIFSFSPKKYGFLAVFS